MEIFGIQLTPDTAGTILIIIGAVFGIGKFADSSANNKSGMLVLFVIGAVIYAAAGKFINF
jgi:uncharacterized protein (DUF697 family)